MESGPGQAKILPPTGVQLDDHCIVVLLPLFIDGLPLILRQPIDVGGDAIVLPGADQVSGEITPGKVPICTKLPERLGIADLWHVWFRLDGKVGMTKLVGPLVLGI